MTYTTDGAAPQVPAPHLAPAGPRLTPDRYTGRTVTPAKGRLAGHAVTYGKRLYGTGYVVVVVDGCRLAWAPGAALRVLLDGAAQ